MLLMRLKFSQLNNNIVTTTSCLTHNMVVNEGWAIGRYIDDRLSVSLMVFTTDLFICP